MTLCISLGLVYSDTYTTTHLFNHPIITLGGNGHLGLLWSFISHIVLLIMHRLIIWIRMWHLLRLDVWDTSFYFSKTRESNSIRSSTSQVFQPNIPWKKMRRKEVDGIRWECLLFPFVRGTGTLQLRRLFNPLSSSLFILWEANRDPGAIWVLWEETAVCGVPKP